jgi:hypothetical protein
MAVLSENPPSTLALPADHPYRTVEFKRLDEDFFSEE